MKDAEARFARASHKRDPQAFSEDELAHLSDVGVGKAVARPFIVYQRETSTYVLRSLCLIEEAEA